MYQLDILNSVSFYSVRLLLVDIKNKLQNEVVARALNSLLGAE